MLRLPRALLLALALLLAGAPLPARAQGVPAPTPAPAAAPATVPPEDIDRLVTTLQDDAARAKLVASLKALEAAERGAAPAPAPAPSTLVERAAAQLAQMGTDLAESAGVLVNAPLAFRWLERQLTVPAARDRWVDVGEHLGTIFGAAILAYLVTAFLLAPLRRRLGRRAAVRWSARLALLAGRLILDALPPLAFAAAGYAVMPLVATRFTTERVANELIAAVLLARMILILARALLLAPGEAAWALLPISEETASYLYVWTRRFVVWTVYGFALVSTTWWLGVPGALYITLQKAVALVLTVLAIVFVLQNRQPVAAWLRPRPPSPADGAARAFRHPVIRMLRERLADIWHVLALAYMIAIFGVYALHIEGGFDFVVRGTLLSVVVIVAARLLVEAAARLAERGFAIPADLNERLPTLERRANRYLPILTTLAAIAIWSVATLSLLEVWGVGSYAWLGTELGRRVTTSATTIAAIVAIGFLVSELANAAIDRHLAGLEPAGGELARRARMRTLLPLLRNALWFTILVIVALLVLSQLGLDITPLLAGAGVVGLAVGFGSQALVKDIITGLFILIEDTIAVGDVVDFGKDHSGVVESLTVRTVRLRDQRGVVHTVPFSEIATVRNLTKNFAYWVIDLTVSNAADTDRVLEIYRTVAAALRQDPAFAPSILSDLEPIGVTAFGSGSVQVQARVKTLPFRQWAVGYELNRRLRTALAEAGIALPSGSQTLQLGPDAATFLERLFSAETARPGDGAGPPAPPHPAPS